MAIVRILVIRYSVIVRGTVFGRCFYTGLFFCWHRRFTTLFYYCYVPLLVVGLCYINTFHMAKTLLDKAFWHWGIGTTKL